MASNEPEVRKIEPLAEVSPEIAVEEQPKLSPEEIEEEARRRAAEIIKEAEEQKKQIMNQAVKEAKIKEKSLREAASEEGYKEGQLRAKEEYENKLLEIEDEKAKLREEFEAEAREFPKYNSAYKTMHMEKKPNLALDVALKSENLKQAIPQFCSDIYGQVSVFENEELKKQLLHFMGQTCDLYLYPKVDNVYYDGTLDALRRSVLEIEKLRPSLSKKDLKNLRTLIENLD